MPLPSPTARLQPGPLGLLLIGLTCLASGAGLAAGRSLLRQLAPPLSPASPAALLQHTRHWSVDPERRREAALLLSAADGTTPAARARLLRGQGWGTGPLAAVTLKQAALAAEASGQPAGAEALWQQLLGRFPRASASADALYALGRGRPALRQRLLQHFPAHPAALAAALEARRPLHLARWGPRWPGAEPLLRRHCQQPPPGLSAADRRQLAGALAQLGDGAAALRCLAGQAAEPALELSLARALLKGSAADQQQAEQRLLQLARQRPTSDAGQTAAALLAQQPGAGSLQALAQLPPSLRNGAAVQARLALEGQVPWQTVLQRWPREASSWDLQWDLARKALLERRWQQSATLLASLDSRLLPAPLAARQLFWLGYSARERGDREGAHRHWRQLLAISPGGYYAWRARQRLGEPAAAVPLDQNTAVAGAPELAWQPLVSGDSHLDALWRLGQPLEAWEHWRHSRGGRTAEGSTALLLEGRLRTAIGDDWTGLGQLEQAGLQLPPTDCRRQWQRELQQHPRRFQAAFGRAAAAQRLDPNLLLAVARQESRFTPAVLSSVGAVGLLQVMPETGSELAGTPLTVADLQDPSRNAALGAQFMRQLLDRWRSDPFLSVASYNAGPGAVEGWRSGAAPDVQREPELWAEAIPYPETRLYTKKVLGNLWTYRQMGRAAC